MQDKILEAIEEERHNYALKNKDERGLNILRHLFFFYRVTLDIACAALLIRTFLITFCAFAEREVWNDIGRIRARSAAFFIVFALVYTLKTFNNAY